MCLTVVGCRISGCSNPTSARGLCRKHYYQLKDQGSLPPKLLDGQAYADRFLRTRMLSTTVDIETDCWIWAGNNKRFLKFGTLVVLAV